MGIRRDMRGQPRPISIVTLSFVVAWAVRDNEQEEQLQSMKFDSKQTKPAIGAEDSNPIMQHQRDFLRVWDSAPARAIINLAAFCHNVEVLTKAAKDIRAGVKLMAVVKADAYGHGAVRVANHILTQCDERVRVDHFAVGTLQEGVELRVGLPSEYPCEIVVLGTPLKADIPLMLKYDLQAVVNSVQVAQDIRETVGSADGQKKLSVHIYADSGMTRLGLREQDVNATLAELETVRERISIVGLYSHFADADDPHSEYVGEQVEVFRRISDQVNQALSKNIPLHVSNSAALLDKDFHELIKTKFGQKTFFVRPGLALYGFYPRAATAHIDHFLGENIGGTRRPWLGRLRLHSSVEGELVEAMTFVATVTNLVDVNKDTPVGYSHDWTAAADTRVATLGVGYADGYPRSASQYQVSFPDVVAINGRSYTNRETPPHLYTLDSIAQVTIKGAFYPIVGNIRMDMMMVDLGSNDTGVKVGDQAVLFGPGITADGEHDGPLKDIFPEHYANGQVIIAGGVAAEELALQCNTIHWEILSGVQKRVRRIYVEKANL